jgi:hypothetical protein
MIRSTKLRFVPLAAILFASILPLTGCEQGPAEKAGADIDKGVEKVKDTVSPPGPLEKAGRTIDKAAH